MNKIIDTFNLALVLLVVIAIAAVFILANAWDVTPVQAASAIIGKLQGHDVIIVNDKVYTIN